MEGAAAMVAAEAANPSNVDIDALPYVDQQMETIEQMKAYVDHLVAEEMKTFAPRDYLSHLPEPELKFLERPMLKAELERVQAGGEMAQMDTSRYAVAPPSGGAGVRSRGVEGRHQQREGAAGAAGGARREPGAAARLRPRELPGL